jgi:MFS family permease
MLTVTSIPQAMNEAPMGPIHWKIFGFAALGIFIDGYDFFIIAAALPLINNVWNPAPEITGLIGASATVGAVFGGVFLGRWADRWGRRTLAMLTMTMFALLSLASAAAWNPLSLIIIRFLLGAWIGADYPTGSAYVAEFMPLRRRSQLLFASLSFQAGGAIAGALTGLALLQAHGLDTWRILLGFGFIPAIVILVLRRQLPESPRWLYADGKIDEARAALEKIFGEPVKLDVQPEPAAPSLPISTLFSGAFIRRTAIACVPWFCMDVALYGMALFTPIILASTAFASANETFWTRDIKSLEGAIWLDLFLLAGFAAGIWAVARAGVYRMQIAGFCGMIVGLLIVASAAAAQNTVLIFLGFAIFNLLVNAGPNGTTYMVPALIFPTRIRASASGLATSCGKIGASVGIFFMPIAQHRWGLSVTVLVVACVALAGLATTYALRKELGDQLHHDVGRPLLVPA